MKSLLLEKRLSIGQQLNHLVDRNNSCSCIYDIWVFVGVIMLANISVMNQHMNRY